jgi:predicted DNA-binding transcriptional regulator AlpA
MDEEDLLTAPEVAKMLGVTSAAINRWCKLGDFPNAFKLNPSRPKSPWRIPRSDVEALKQKRREQYGYIRLPVAPKVEKEAVLV